MSIFLYLIIIIERLLIQSIGENIEKYEISYILYLYSSKKKVKVKNINEWLIHKSNINGFLKVLNFCVGDFKQDRRFSISYEFSNIEDSKLSNINVYTYTFKHIYRYLIFINKNIFMYSS